MALKKGLIVPLLAAVVSAGVSVVCALRFQSGYFQQLDCITTASAACANGAEKAAETMALWGVLAAVSAFVASACMFFLCVRLWRGMR